MRPKKTLLELRITGFNKLRSGKIHLRCPSCGRKHSNATREEYDPARAFLLEVLCEKCSQGCKDGFGGYFDENGKEIDYEEGLYEDDPENDVYIMKDVRNILWEELKNELGL